MKGTRVLAGWFLLLFSSLAVSTAVGARPTGPDPDRVAAMKALDFLVGTWEGGGWMELGSQGRRHFRGREVVELRLGGTILMIEGTHYSAESPEDDPLLVHHALAVVSPDGEGGYRFDSWLFNRDGGNFEGRIEDGAFVWGTSADWGEMRYTIRRDEEGRWFEIGEMRRGEDPWRQFFEMTLEPVGD